MTITHYGRALTDDELEGEARRLVRDELFYVAELHALSITDQPRRERLVQWIWGDDRLRA